MMERRHQRLLGEFFARDVDPVIDDHWDRGDFPHALVPKLAGVIQDTYGPYEPRRPLLRRRRSRLRLRGTYEMTG